jgi:large subunit ribosomal protein L10
MLNGQLAAGFALREAPNVAKAFLDFAKTQDKLIVRGGVVQQSALTADQVEAFSKLPGLDQLRGQLLGMLQAPSRGIVSAVANGVRQVVNVVDAWAKKDETAAAEAAAEAGA